MITVPPGVLSGIVTVSFTGVEVPAPEGLDMGVDGHWCTPRADAQWQATFQLNTVQLADGNHTLQFASWAAGGTLTALEQVPITTSNGNTVAAYPVDNPLFPLPLGQPIPQLPGTTFPLSMFNLAAPNTDCQAVGINTYESELGSAKPVQAGWNVLALADNLGSSPAQEAAFLASPEAQVVAANQAGALDARGDCVAILAPDESNARFGNTSLPIVAAIAQAMRGHGLPLGWPIDSTGTSQAITAAWTAAAIADCACLYTICVDQYLYRPRSKAQSMHQFREQLRWSLGTIPVGMPRIVQIYAAGNLYKRGTPGANTYLPSDTLINAAVTAAQILGQAGVALCYGACMFRYWAYDWPNWVAARANHPMGSQVAEGTSLLLGPDRWSALGLVNSAIAILTSRLFAPVQEAPAWGSDWETCARTGLFLGVNCTDNALPLPALPAGYTTGWTLTPAGFGPMPVANELLAPGGWCVLIA